MPNRYLLTWIAALLTTYSSASGQAVGLSYLGMCHPSWQCEKSLAVFDGASVIRTGWLETTFGSSCICAEKLLNDPRPKEIRVHLTNGPCLRNRRCGPYEPLAGETIVSSEKKILRGNRRLLMRFKRAAQRVSLRLARSRGPLTCYVSPVLESDYGEQARAILHRLTASVLPGCTLVDSIHRRVCLRGKVCEVHGASPRVQAPCIADTDGVSFLSISTPQFLRATRGCRMSLLWSERMNCFSPTDQTFIDPRQRNCAQSDWWWAGLKIKLMQAGLE